MAIHATARMPVSSAPVSSLADDKGLTEDLHDALINHGVSNLAETGDIGAQHQVAR